MSEERISRVFQLIKKSKELEDHFFRKLSTTDNPFPWFKILKEKGYLSAEKNPFPIQLPDKEGFYQVPYWPVLGYLENVAIKNSKTPNNEVLELLIETIDSIVNYTDEKGQRIENYKTDWMLIKTIFKLPIDKIKKEYVDFVGSALRSKWDTTLVASEIGKTVVPYLIANKARDLILQLLEVIASYKHTGSSFDFESLMGDYWFHDLMQNHRNAIIELCGVDTARVAIRKMDEIIATSKLQFSQAVLPAIEDSSQTLFPDRYECQLVYLARETLNKASPEEAKPLVVELTAKEHEIFKRIAVYAINFHFGALVDIFWNWTGNPLEERGLKHEIYELLKTHCSSFSAEQIERILTWIESETITFSEETRQNKELVKRLTAYSRKEWLSALLETGDPRILEAYQRYSQVYPEEIEHPGLSVWFGQVEFVGEPAPFANELLKKTNKEIADYVLQQAPKERAEYNERLEGSFRRTVRENASKFSHDMLPFLSMPPSYQYALLSGLLEAWRTNSDFPWDELLNYADQMIDKQEFWEQKYENRFNYRNWIVGIIAELIEEGTRDDRRAFDPKLLPSAEKILFTLARNAESDIADVIDIVNSVLNSTRGKIFSAMVSFSLRVARLSKQEKEKRWKQEIKEYFTKGLERTNEFSSIEFSVTIGEYLPQLYYLDEKWVSGNINRIFPKEDEHYWTAAFTGYLFHSSQLFKDLYLLLRNNSHYSKALETKFKDSIGLQRTVQHIGIAYLLGLESLDDKTSLINQMLERKNPDQLLELVRFFWALRDKLPDEYKPRINPLWGKLFERLSAHTDPMDEKILAHLFGWLTFIDELDEQALEWLKLSARYIQPVEEILFMDYLLKHAQKTPDKVAIIYLEMLNSDRFPSHDQQKIRELVTMLYEKGEKQAADRICNLYFSKGLLFLRDIYEKNTDPRLSSQ